MTEEILSHRVDCTRYTVHRDITSRRLIVEAHTKRPSFITDDIDLAVDVLGPNDPVKQAQPRIIPAVDERFHHSFQEDQFEGDEYNRAAEALAAGLRVIQPKIEENERRRQAGEQTLQEYEAEMRREARERDAELKYLAEAAAREAERQQEELEALPCFGMF